MADDIGDDIRWGILATGKIAQTFARDLALVPGARLAAVGSRRARERRRPSPSSTARAAAYGSYEELVADPAVDVVYIATPHALHLDNARLCFEAGKHVLCEKPLTLDAADAEEMVRLAGEHDRFLMEAMWTACHPVIRELRDAAGAGEFGTPRHLHAELGFRVDAGPDDRMLDPALGASALLDMGIYPLTFAHLMLGDGRAADRDRRPVRPRHRPRHRGRRPLPRRRARDDDRLDDVVLLAHAPRSPPTAAGSTSTTSTTRRRPSSRRTARAAAAGSSSRASRSRCSARSR